MTTRTCVHLVTGSYVWSCNKDSGHIIQSAVAGLEVKREYYQNCSVLGCVTQCSQSAAHSYEKFLQVQQIRFVTLGPLRHA